MLGPLYMICIDKKDEKQRKKCVVQCARACKSTWKLVGRVRKGGPGGSGYSSQRFWYCMYGSRLAATFCRVERRLSSSSADASSCLREHTE